MKTQCPDCLKLKQELDDLEVAVQCVVAKNTVDKVLAERAYEELNRKHDILKSWTAWLVEVLNAENQARLCDNAVSEYENIKRHALNMVGRGIA